jgi:hypothetical protein
VRNKKKDRNKKKRRKTLQEKRNNLRLVAKRAAHLPPHPAHPRAIDRLLDNYAI